MLRLSGEVADGSVLSISAGLDYLRWANVRIVKGRARGGRAGAHPHPITVFAIYAVDEDGNAARASARARLAFYR
jgi:5,10-methylenetetrahydromethanopterin reductase